MAEDSYRRAVSAWIDVHSWPRPIAGREDGEKCIFVITGVAKDRSSFSFHSSFGYFQIKATYHRIRHELNDIIIALVIPQHPRVVILVRERSYELKVEDGRELLFNIGKGAIRGKFCLKYADRDDRREIALKYDVDLPFAGRLEGIAALCPIELNAESGFTDEELQIVPAIASPELQPQELEEEEQHELTLKFLRDFCRDGDKVVIETFYEYREDSKAASKPQALVAKSAQYHLSIAFLKVLDLVGSIDPTKLIIAAALYIKVPIIGRVQIAKLEGSLISGVKVNVNVAVAKGNVTLGADKNSKGKHELFIILNLDVKGIGKVGDGKRYNLVTLPF